MKKKFKKTNIRQSNKGFTLIEIILVLMITAVGFTAIYALYASNIKHQTESRYEIIASNLAQEAIEIIRNRRDETIMQGNDISNVLSPFGLPRDDCGPFYVGGPILFAAFFPKGWGSCGYWFLSDKVCFDEPNQYYRNCYFWEAAANTPFSRTCDVSSSDTDGTLGDDTLTVVCTVSWDSFVNPDIERSISATSILTDWDGN